MPMLGTHPETRYVYCGADRNETKEMSFVGGAGERAATAMKSGEFVDAECERS